MTSIHIFKLTVTNTRYILTLKQSANDFVKQFFFIKTRNKLKSSKQTCMNYLDLSNKKYKLKTQLGYQFTEKFIISLQRLKHIR